MGDVKLIQVKEGILEENNRKAAAVRARLAESGTFLLNIMASPGGGKTSLILRTIERLRHRFRIGVIEADIDSSVDAEKVAAIGTTATQLRTGGFCHLDASMMEQGLDSLDGESFDLIMVENIGNLVCPADFDIGAQANIMILSLPEGDDKPLKYPLMFSTSQALVVNKVDYRELAEFDLELLKERVFKLNSKLAVFPLSCRTGEGLEAWVDWLAEQVERSRGV
jgi:hydrogenase nickel incorporation protein HypB